MTSQLRPFSEWLTDHAQGVADAEATAALAEVVEAVTHHGKAGTVTLKVKVVTVPPHPRRPAGPYCPTCGTTPPLHLFACTGPETEGDPVAYDLPDGGA